MIAKGYRENRLLPSEEERDPPKFCRLLAALLLSIMAAHFKSLGILCPSTNRKSANIERCTTTQIIDLHRRHTRQVAASFHSFFNSSLDEFTLRKNSLSLFLSSRFISGSEMATFYTTRDPYFLSLIFLLFFLENNENQSVESVRFVKCGRP